MAQEGLIALLSWLQVLQPAFTQPGFANMVVLFTGWVRTNGPHAVTQALVFAEVAGHRHHEAFHRFFSRGAWEPDQLGRLLFQLIVRMLPEESAVPVVVDDTVAPKKGPHIFGLGSHLDAVRSTKRRKVFCFGHCWVVLAVLMSFPFSRRTWALPVLFRLYRNKKECAAKGHPYRKKTELARETLDVLLSWTGGRRVELTADLAYCNSTVMRGLPESIILIGAMRPDAVLTAPPPRCRGQGGGRLGKRSQLLPKPQVLADDERHPWQSCEVETYGERRTVQFKSFCAQWYRACGERLLRIVIVQTEQGSLKFRVFFSTDSTHSVLQIIEGYAGRWAIEVCFRDIKQLLGFADSSARKQNAVERVAPFVGFMYTLLVLWFATGAYQAPFAAPPVRPWYRHKDGLSFADILRAAQRVLATFDVLDPDNVFNTFNIPYPVPFPSEGRLRRVA